MVMLSVSCGTRSSDSMIMVVSKTGWLQSHGSKCRRLMQVYQFAVHQASQPLMDFVLHMFLQVQTLLPGWCTGP